MKTVIEKRKELNAQIRDSKEYNNYISTSKALKEDWELYQAFNDFRRKNYIIQNSNEDRNFYDEIEALNNEFASVLNNSKVSEFVSAEHRICKLMKSVYTSISDSLEFDYDFINGF